MLNDPSVRDKLYERLRRPPSPHTVPGSLPVLFFGEIDKATIATVGINPSHQEYLNTSEHELTGKDRRLQTLTSLDSPSRAELTSEQCDRAISGMRSYFHPGKPVYSKWFGSLDLMIQAMGYSYGAGEVVSLDLVQEATNPKWSDLDKQFPYDTKALLVADLPFLRWQLATFPLRAVVCNGMTPLQYLWGLLDQPLTVAPMPQGQMGKRMKWYATPGQIAGRRLVVTGWNIPLRRPHSLADQGKADLGRKLKQAINQLGS